MSAERPAGKERGSAGVAGVAVMWVAPFVLGVACVFGLVRASWLRCTGGLVSHAYTLTGYFWLVATPVLAYVGTGLLAMIGWRRRTTASRAGRAVVGSLLAAAVFGFFAVRYYHLTQAQCVDGLPTWWPSWLPAYG